MFKVSGQVVGEEDELRDYLKVLQVVSRGGLEVVLKYNAGTADFVKGNGIVTVDITEQCRRVIFSNKTTLKEKVKALEELYVEDSQQRIDSIISKYGNVTKNVSEKPSSVSRMNDGSTKGQSSDVVSEPKTAPLKHNFRPASSKRNFDNTDHLQSLNKGYTIGKYMLF